MASQLVKTALEGYPHQYGQEVVGSINRVWGDNVRNSIALFQMKDLAESVKGHTNSHMQSIKTDDGYRWFSGITLKVGDANVKVLLPWCQDFNHPETKMDRSVNVYSDKPLPDNLVASTMENVAYKLALITPLKNPLYELSQLGKPKEFEL